MCAQTLMHAVGHRGCINTVRKSALFHSFYLTLKKKKNFIGGIGVGKFEMKSTRQTLFFNLISSTC